MLSETCLVLVAWWEQSQLKKLEIGFESGDRVGKDVWEQLEILT